MNGYFQLVNTPQGTGIRIYAPTDGGKSLNVNVVREYLDERKIQYDVIKLNDAVNKSDANVYVFTEAKVLPEREGVKFDVSKDKMTVTAFFYPPTEGAQLMTEAEFRSSIAYRKYTYGIQEENIKAFFEHREYCKEILIAKGKEVVQGKNAYVEYHFNTNLRARPTLKEDGSVDYFHLNLINNINEGDLLATLHREVPGVPGINVYGEQIKPAVVKPSHIDRKSVV